MKFGKQDWATPREFLSLFETFDVDLAAHAGNFRFEPWCGPGSPHVTPSGDPMTDALSLNWAILFGDKSAWLNPPFSKVEPWVKKAAEETERYSEKGMITMLVPASFGTRWWEYYVNGVAQVTIVRPRLTFEGATAPYMGKDLCLLSYKKERFPANVYRILDVGQNDGAFRKRKATPESRIAEVRDLLDAPGGGLITNEEALSLLNTVVP